MKTKVVVMGAPEGSRQALATAAPGLPELEIELVDASVRALRRLADPGYEVDAVVVGSVENASDVAKTLLEADPRRFVLPLGQITNLEDARAILDLVRLTTQARRERGELLLTIIAHDLRAPLGVALGALGEMTHPAVGALNDEQAGLVRLTRRSLDRLTRFSANLSQLARIDARTLELVRARADVGALARDIAQRVARDEGGAIEVTFDTSSVHAEIDRDKLALAIENVVSNALRHARGRVVIHAAREADDAVLTVTDDGPGLPPGVVDIFDRVRLAERRAGRTGSGLGLAVVLGVFRAHGGTARAENVVDEGTTRGARFSLRLPAID